MAISTHDAANARFPIDARERMVDSQLRPNKVSDLRVLEAMRQLPRERFLPASQAALAYADANISLGSGRAMLQPMVLARLVQAAVPLRGEKALVVGAGTGYSAALMAEIGCEVTAVEEPGAMADRAKQTLAEVAPSVALVTGPLTAGWPATAPYDVILIDGAVPEIPRTLTNQLNRETGRLVTIIDPAAIDPGGIGPAGIAPAGPSGGGAICRAVHAELTPAGISARPLFDCVCPVLPAFAPAPTFAF
jgi:protein-L-isoaspartate(D-aspartate) O-methyltransferase